MGLSKKISIAVILVIGIFVCIFTTACTNDSVSSSININKESRFANFYKNETSNPQIVYLGDQMETGLNFGPSDISFEVRSLR